jgi:hypothetical protein
VPPVVASFNVIVPFEHKLVAPVIDAALFILTTIDALQPEVPAGL